ncbi:MAG TPA: guanylate kinase [Candidatus Kapabacteria bacterium]|nr:guanylate kinase [Candidatus Kapabacteria bacterium]
MILKKFLIVLSSPSGGGKTTVAQSLLKKYKQLKFSISATTRPQRHNEQNGRDYFFISKEEFEERIIKNEFVEYEKIFDNYYGTLKTQIQKAVADGVFLLFDIDVKGALALKEAFPNNTALIFLVPPSLEELENRLRNRATESQEELDKRLKRAKMEFEYQNEFDYIVINDELNKTLSTVDNIVSRIII